jgi:hypothetical protein
MLNGLAVRGFAKQSGNERFAFDFCPNRAAR